MIDASSDLALLEAFWPPEEVRRWIDDTREFAAGLRRSGYKPATVRAMLRDALAAAVNRGAADARDQELIHSSMTRILDLATEASEPR